ncbi:hypothetical protein GOV06_02955 [Candidatus Woesearchaeota archaeon]|nr:hypothetical protein [Candidatus Woesearchaeota archaeon]
MAVVKGAAVYDERRLKFTNPEDFKQIMRECPLDKEFIDWVVTQGYKIRYHSKWSKGKGRIFTYPLQGTIHVSTNNGDNHNLTDLILVHEFVHIAVPDERLGLCLWIYNRNNINILNQYEEAIDEIAKEIVQDTDFMSYLKENIPSKSGY